MLVPFFISEHRKETSTMAAPLTLYNSFHIEDAEGWRYSYTTEPLWGVGWQYDGVAFYAPLPSGQTVPLYSRPPSIEKVPVRDEFQLGWGVNVMSGTLREYAVKGLQTTSWNDFSEV